MGGGLNGPPIIRPAISRFADRKAVKRRRLAKAFFSQVLLLSAPFKYSSHCNDSGIANPPLQVRTHWPTYFAAKIYDTHTLLSAAAAASKNRQQSKAGWQRPCEKCHKQFSATFLASCSCRKNLLCVSYVVWPGPARLY